jgi:hypothetical protein
MQREAKNDETVEHKLMFFSRKKRNIAFVFPFLTGKFTLVFLVCTQNISSHERAQTMSGKASQNNNSNNNQKAENYIMTSQSARTIKIGT